MVRRSHAQRSVFEVLLPDGEKLWNPVLRRIDEVLGDEELVVVEALERRRPGSRKRGRPGSPAEVVLRMLVLKHLYDWSFDECERPIGHSIDDHCSTVPAHGLLKRPEDAERPMVCPAKPRRAATVPSAGRIASFEGA